MSSKPERIIAGDTAIVNSSNTSLTKKAKGIKSIAGKRGGSARPIKNVNDTQIQNDSIGGSAKIKSGRGISPLVKSNGLVVQNQPSPAAKSINNSLPASGQISTKSKQRVIGSGRTNSAKPIN